MKSDNNWVVWVGGVEVNDYYLSETQAKRLAQQYIDDGHDDVIVESYATYKGRYENA